MRFIFSSFWVWLGFVVLVAAAGGAVVEIVKAIRPARKIAVYRTGDVVRVEVEGAGRGDIPAAVKAAKERDPADDERMMMAIYHSEQVHPFPRYKNALEQFKADWAAGTYDPGATLCFQPEDVEEIEVLCEEIVPEPQTATPPPRTPKKKRKKRRRK